eukprot:Nitzschia sp. Nitz4//scaffold43_size134323//96810//97778//NITZ4_003314-RA/size134323-augustus-gene-0.224-mRNA-1//1//CDS//3329551993//3063//frame0
MSAPDTNETQPESQTLPSEQETKIPPTELTSPTGPEEPSPSTENVQEEEHPVATNEDAPESQEETNPETSEPSSSLPPRPLKRARTAYFIFAEEKRPEIQAEHPGEGVASVARIMGQKWASLTPEDKEVYQQKAAEERERVARQLEEYKAAGGVIEADNAKDSASPSSLVFPVARIRKICKLDPEVRGLSKEALLLITKCAELATAKLGTESVRVAQLQNRRKLLPEDVAHVCSHREQFLFLKADVKDLLNEQNPTKAGGSTSHPARSDAIRQAAAVGTSSITSFFQPKVQE